MVLFIGKESSWFVSSNILERKRLTDDAVKMGMPLGSTMRDPAIQGLKITTPQIFKKIPNGVFSEVRFMIKHFVWEDSLPKFSWEVSNDTNMVNGLKVVAAYTKFKGRSYKAWYCPEIPVPDGPWKFYGLPGLILQVVDSKNEVKFTMQELEMQQHKSHPIQLSSTVIKVTKEEFNKLREAYVNDPVGMMNSLTGTQYRISGGTVPTQKRETSKNKIELE